MKRPLWGSYPLPTDKPICWDFGPLKIWAKTVADELWISFQHADPLNTAPQAEPDCAVPEGVGWERWSKSDSEREIEFQPVFPDRAIVAKPEHPFWISSGVETRIYVRVPVWVRISMSSKLIVEIPTIVLSKTWFGNFLSGELCYWVSTSARKRIEPNTTRPFLAICPIKILNHSGEALEVDKLCHRVNRLAIYSLEQQMWANETVVNFRNAMEGSDLDISDSAPAEVSEATLIMEARDPVRRGFSAKTFDTLKDLSWLDFLHR